MQNWIDKIVKWFEEEISNSNKPLDEHWEIERENEKKLIVSSPCRPYTISVSIGERFVSLQIKTGIETAVLDTQERLKIYRFLLLLNSKWRMVKYALVGENEEVVVTTELDLLSLSREEFNDGLTVTLLAMNDLMKKLNMDEKYQEAQLNDVEKIILQKIKENKSKEEIVNYVVKTYKISKYIVEEIVEKILREDEDISRMYT